MELLVASKHLAAEMTTALDVQGREHLVIVVKSSWQIPQPGQRPRPLVPTPLAAADEFVGEPGESAMRYGGDFARFKPRCDVLFNAQAHAPNGKEVRELAVAFKVGDLKKGLKVFGPRTWRKRLGLYATSTPEPFVSMPLHYGLAFGGTRTYTQGRGDNAQTLSEAFLSNPAGIGWAGPKTSGELHGEPAPSLEGLSDTISSPTGKHTACAFSAVARHWQPRSEYTGTYDDKWLHNVSPFLPEDFDEQYHQCAPQDQQIAYPQGGEEVVLRNLMAGRDVVRFKLPLLDSMQVRVLRTDYSTASPKVVVDTLYFEPDQERFSAVWRASLPIQRRIQEIDTVAIGPIDVDWWQNKILGLDGEGCAGCGPASVPERTPEEASA
jgi:hypothetical protein